jgi:hypothetical protein
MVLHHHIAFHPFGLPFLFHPTGQNGTPKLAIQWGKETIMLEFLPSPSFPLCRLFRKGMTTLMAP